MSAPSAAERQRGLRFDADGLRDVLGHELGEIEVLKGDRFAADGMGRPFDFVHARLREHLADHGHHGGPVNAAPVGHLGREIGGRPAHQGRAASLPGDFRGAHARGAEVQAQSRGISKDHAPCFPPILGTCRFQLLADRGRPSASFPACRATPLTIDIGITAAKLIPAAKKIRKSHNDFQPVLRAVA